MKLDAINFRDGNSWTSLKDLIYPLGSIYMNANKTDNDPGNTIGDTWVKIESRFLLGQSSSYTIGATGGAATHTLTLSEMPIHNHYIGAHGGDQYLANVPFVEDHSLTYMNGQNIYYPTSNEGGGNLTTICRLIKSLLYGREQRSLLFGGVVA